MAQKPASISNSIQSPRPVSGGGKSGKKNTAYTMQRHLNANKVHEFSLITGENFCKYGYRNREDITSLPPGVMVIGSYNILTNTSNRIGVTKGYTLDGQSNSTITPITSSYDFTKLLSNDTHVRSYGINLQFRYVHPVTSVVSWVTFFTGLTVGNDVNYSQYWDSAQLSTVLLFVNGNSNIYRWSGAVASFASATTNTITKSGASTWAQAGFDATTGDIIINGVAYAYTGGTGTTTLTGVSPDPTLGGYAVGTAITQKVGVTATTPIAGYNNDLIANLSNQIFIGSKTSAIIYTSKVNDYTNYAQSSPRLVGEGNSATIAGYPTAFVNQENHIYVSGGKDLWYETQFDQTTTSISDGATPTPGAITTIYETLTYQQLKTTELQAAQSQAAVTKIKNDIVFLSFEPIINSLGRVENVVLTPQVTDLSYPIVNDMDRYDWEFSSMIYYRQYLYVSVPRESLIRVYNMTNPEAPYWEAPLTFPIARFSIINDELYGHGFSVPETYKLFDGYMFNGNPIPAAVYFSYNQYGTRTYPKDFNLFYLEGYITSNCVLNYGMNFDIDGCQTQRNYDLAGTLRPQVCSILPDASLGKESLGKRPLSGFTIPGNTATSTETGLPPKFRGIKQMSKFPFYELQVFFESLGSDQQWELIGFGPNVGPATEGNNSIQY